MSKKENAERLILTPRPLTYVLFVLALFMLLIGAGVTSTPFLFPPKNADEAVIAYTLPFALALGAVGVGVGLFFKIRHVLLSEYIVDLKGITRRSSGGKDVWWWDEIAEIRIGNAKEFWNDRPCPNLSFVIIHKDFRRMVLVGELLANSDRLREALDGHLLRTREEQTIAQFREGGLQYFGPLTVTREGLRNESELLRWAEIERAELRDGGKLRIRRVGAEKSWFLASVAQVPNLPLLFALIREGNLQLLDEPESSPRERAKAPPQAAAIRKRGDVAEDILETAQEHRRETSANKELWERETITAEELLSLGAAERIHAPKGEKTVSGMAGLLICGGLAVVFGVLGLVLTFFTDLGKDRSGGPSYVLLIFLEGLAGVLLVSGIAFAIQGAKRKYSLHVYPEGFAWVGARGADLYSWDQVAKIWLDVVRVMIHGQYAGTNYHIRIETDTGRKLHIQNECCDLDAFCDLLARRTHKRLLREARRTIDDGEVVNFGMIEVEAKGLRVDDRSYRWAKVQEVSFDQGLLVLHAGGLRQQHIAAEVPNVNVLIELAQDFIRK